MSANQILLIVISGLGVIHGLFLAVFLWTYGKGHTLSNRLLSLLLVVLSFRVGKSVFLEFLTDLNIKIIFIGLSGLLAIGPLFYLFTLSVIDSTFKLNKRHLLHFIFVIPALAFGFFITEPIARNLPMYFFAALFLTYYGHYLAYMIRSYGQISNSRKSALTPDSYSFLMLMFYGLVLVWLVYVLNLFDEFVPYIVGPILYTLIAYVITYVVIKKGYLLTTSKYKTTSISNDQVEAIFIKVTQLINGAAEFKNPDISLKSLSEKLNVSSQTLSMVVNQKTNLNFNSYINQHRINAAVDEFQNPKNDHLTIAAIAFSVGFNSLSSFNAAFKKQLSRTPLEFRKSISK
jgi:AraC-like DNA-binding protein